MLSARAPRLWVSGDWNALFGFGTNILVNLLVMTSLLRFVLEMPDELVFGRILPATGLMLFLSTGYYAWLAFRLARETGRNDVCALPSGFGVAHMFVVVFVIMAPIKAQTNDPVAAWEAGMAWVFIQSVILILGGFMAPLIRRITPRAAMLGTLAGVSITFISMRPALEMLTAPLIGLLCFAVILHGWFGRVRYPLGLPAGLIAIMVGLALAWGGHLLGFDLGGLSLAGVSTALLDFGFYVPLPAIDHVFSGFAFLGILLVTAIPFGIYDLVEATDNVESAAAAGDEYSTRRVVCADGVVSMIGCLMGNPFVNAVYIGHPGWKSMGGRIGYSLVTGLVVLALSMLGLLPVLLALIPLAAILPILLYIGLLIGAQAFQESPARHAPAVVLALIPHLAAWGKNQVDNALQAAGTSAGDVGHAVLTQSGVIYHGLEVLGGGAILTAIIWSGMAIAMIDQNVRQAVSFALAGAVLSFFGLMHSEAVAWGASTELALAYVLVAGLLLVNAFVNKVELTAPVASGTDTVAQDTIPPQGTSDPRP